MPCEQKKAKRKASAKASSSQGRKNGCKKRLLYEKVSDRLTYVAKTYTPTKSRTSISPTAFGDYVRECLLSKTCTSGFTSHPHIHFLSHTKKSQRSELFELVTIKGQSDLWDLYFSPQNAQNTAPLKMVPLIAYQMLQALVLMKHNAITHTDIKPENIIEVKPCHYSLIDWEGGTLPNAVLSNNTLANIGPPLRSTFAYSAPELLKRNSNNHEYQRTWHTDMWSLGATLLSLLMGTSWLESNRPSDSYKEIQRLVVHDRESPSGFVLADEIWTRAHKRLCEQQLESLSRPLRSFLEGLLSIDPERRKSPSAALSDPLFKERSIKKDIEGCIRTFDYKRRNSTIQRPVLWQRLKKKHPRQAAALHKLSREVLSAVLNAIRLDMMQDSDDDDDDDDEDVEQDAWANLLHASTYLEFLFLMVYAQPDQNPCRLPLLDIRRATLALHGDDSELQTISVDSLNQMISIMDRSSILTTMHMDHGIVRWVRDHPSGSIADLQYRLQVLLHSNQCYYEV